jgi:hypothetical protein
MTPLVFNIDAGTLLVGLFFFFMTLLAIVWKGKKEISDSIDEKLSPINTNINGISATANRLVVAVTELQTIVQTGIKGAVIHNLLLEKGASPLRPTVVGAKLITDSGLKDVLDNNKEELRIKLSAILPKDPTEYDVQEKARELLLNLKEDSMMNPVKEYVYSNPTDIQVILKVGGLWLRDDFLEHPRAVAPEDIPA